MELFSSVWHVISAALVFVGGACLMFAVGRQFQASNSRIITIYVWHTILCILYCWYAQNNPADANRYYRIALYGSVEFSFGTDGVRYLTAFFVKGVGLSYLGTFLVYNVFGSVGLLIFDASLKVATQNKSKYVKRLATLVVFLPSVSFWSSAIGKDALSFLSISLALWAALDLNRRALIMGFAIFIMLIVRPHIASLMIIGVIMASLFDSNGTVLKKMFLCSIAIVVAALMLPFAMNYVGLGENAGLQNVTDYIEGRQAVNLDGGSSVDIASMSLPMQIITYMFRPFIFEARSIFMIAAAVDNLILLFLFFAGWRAFLGSRKEKIQGNLAFMWGYSLLTWLILAMTSANLGISLRQKWMIAPVLIYLLFSAVKQPSIRKGRLN